MTMATTDTRAGVRRPPLLNPDAYQTVLSTIYIGLATNALLVMACLPLLAVLVAPDGAKTWPAAVLLAPLGGPALVAAFATFAAHAADSTAPVVRTYARAYRHGFRRAIAVGGAATGLIAVMAVDVRAVWGLRVGALAIPVLTVLMVLTAATAVVALIVASQAPTARLRDLVQVGFVLAVRRWYLTLVALGVLWLLAGVVVASPALGLGLTAAPLLYAVWGAGRQMLRALDPGSSLAR